MMHTKKNINLCEQVYCECLLDYTSARLDWKVPLCFSFRPLPHCIPVFFIYFSSITLMYIILSPSADRQSVGSIGDVFLRAVIRLVVKDGLSEIKQ